MVRLLKALLLVAAAAGTVRADDWPAFRGPAGDGISHETDVPTTWGPDTNILWKAPLPRPGNGSPIVSNGRVFVACAEDERGYRRSLYCFDREDGRQLWVRTVLFNRSVPTHRTNPYCGSTPVADGKRVVVWHNSAGLTCYDFEGKQLWHRRLGEFRHMWGYGSSPILHDGKVILNCSPGKRTFVTALDLADGKTLWETEEAVRGDGNYNENKKYMGSWSTPVIARVGGKVQVICQHPTRVRAYDPDRGSVLWTYDRLRGRRGVDLAYASPIVRGDVCVIFTGGNGPAVGIRLGGAGNVSESHQIWRTPKNPQRIGSGVWIGDHLYCPNDRSRTLVQCVDAKTGAVVWDGAEGSGKTWGSIVLAGGNCYVTNRDGKTTVFKPNPEEYEAVAVNDLGEPSNSTPAVSDGRIFIRTFQHLYCIGEKK